MKKRKINVLDGLIVIAALCVLAAVALPVFAGNVYDRTTKTLTAGSGTWTNNTWQYSAVELKRIWIEGSTIAANTVTVNRVTSDSAYTQTVGTVTFTSGSKGNTASFTAAYLKYGDMLVFDSTANSNSTAVIDVEVQQH